MNELKNLIKEIILKDSGNLLKSKFKKEWTESNYTRGYCYIVSEFLYHFYPLYFEYTPHMLYVDGETHWFLKNTQTGEIVDLTASQYPFDLDYSKATKRAFFKGGIPTERGYISKNGMKFYKTMKSIYNKKELWTQLENMQ
jgi:hypothetical protein